MYGELARLALAEQLTRGAGARGCGTIERRRQLQGALHVAANISTDSLQDRYLRFVY